MRQISRDRHRDLPFARQNFPAPNVHEKTTLWGVWTVQNSQQCKVFFCGAGNPTLTYPLHPLPLEPVLLHVILYFSYVLTVVNGFITGVIKPLQP